MGTGASTAIHDSLGFTRAFPVELITDRVLDDTPWFRDLLHHWRLPGDALQTGADDPDRLRLTLRGGYLSFYRKGQSIAKVTFDANGQLQAQTHNKYVYSGGGGARPYVAFTAAGIPDKATGALRPYGGIAEFRTWLANSDVYAGEEKDFVDRVVARNADVIDLEMALPAFAEDPEERVSPRMDLVALEPVGGGWRIVFWEAKRVDDPRLRPRRDQAPEVVAQLAQYVDWLRQPGHRERVAAAYHDNCRLLVRLHAVARKVNPAIGDLGAGIRATAAGASPPLIDDEPKLLIDDRAQSVSFAKNGYLMTLRDEPFNVPVQVVSDLETMTLRTPPKFLSGVPVSHVLDRLAKGGGNELESGKFASPESSAALAANCFGWFVPRAECLPPFPGLEAAFPAIQVEVEYEARFPWSGGSHPWLDAVAITPTHLIGIESKRYEPFRDKKGVSFSDAYDRPVWGDAMGPFEAMRDGLRRGAVRFQHLDAAQLVKHAFGLVTDAKRMSKQATLVYLFAEPSRLANQPIAESAKDLHRAEVAAFANAVAGAAVDFHFISYREWIASWPDDAALAVHGAAVLNRYEP